MSATTITIKGGDDRDKLMAAVALGLDQVLFFLRMANVHQGVGIGPMAYGLLEAHAGTLRDASASTTTISRATVEHEPGKPCPHDHAPLDVLRGPGGGGGAGGNGSSFSSLTARGDMPAESACASCRGTGKAVVDGFVTKAECQACGGLGWTA